MRPASTSVQRRALLSIFLCTALLASFGASAFNPFGRGFADSLALVNIIPPGHFELTTEEQLVILLADPPVAQVSGLSITIGYNPNRFSFVSSLSGLLCEFSVDGSCPPPSAVYGSHLLSSLPVVRADSFAVGTPLPGSTLQVTDDTIGGVVSVVYTLAAPLTLDGSDRNFFAFAFRALQTYNPFATVATFFDKPGNYDFNQLQSSCVASIPQCGSNTPVYGVNIVSIPEPSTYALLLAGFGMLAGALKGKRARTG